MAEEWHPMTLPVKDSLPLPEEQIRVKVHIRDNGADHAVINEVFRRNITSNFQPFGRLIVVGQNNFTAARIVLRSQSARPASDRFVQFG